VFYVGKGSGRRAWNFTFGRNQHHKAVIAKHGAENVVVTIHQCVDEASAFELEMLLIAEYKAKGLQLCNKTDGGEGASGRPVSEKQRAALDANRKLPKTERGRAAASSNLKQLWATNPAMRENAARMAELRRGVKRPAYVVEALVKAHKGKKHTGARLEQIRAAQQIAQEAAKAWHTSDEGRVWHEEHGKKTWVNREWEPCTCQECGRSFNSPFPTRAKYCEPNCRNTAKRRKAGKPVGVRSKRTPPSVLSGKRAAGK
jgi:hypothetical protein